MTFPKRFPDRAEVADVRAEAERLEAGATDDSTKRRLAGRVMARRDLGKLVFLDLVDRSGRIQLICPTERTGELELHLGDIVGVTGSPARARRGELSLMVDALEVLAKIRAPLPDTFHGIEDVELRYRKRYLDLLMSEESRDEVVKRARMVSAIRAYLDGEGFIEVETPILQPRYGGGFAEPYVTHSELLDTDLYLRIADELYLKRLIVGGLEKVYELSKDFRNESYSYKHSPEFSQVEWYEAYADYRDTATRMKELVRHAAEATIGGTRTTFRGHEVDVSQWHELRFVEALDAHGVWTRDEAELRAKLTEAGVDVSSDHSWSQLADHAYSHFVEPELIEPTIVYDWPIELSPFARTTEGDECVQRAQRCSRPGAALRHAGVGTKGGSHRGRARRSGLRRGDVVRNGAERRLWRRCRPAGHGAPREGHDPRRDPLPDAAQPRLSVAFGLRKGPARCALRTRWLATMGEPSTRRRRCTSERRVEGIVRALY
jgi:lysyl-tRNA synthetase class 2